MIAGLNQISNWADHLISSTRELSRIVFFHLLTNGFQYFDDSETKFRVSIELCTIFAFVEKPTTIYLYKTRALLVLQKVFYDIWLIWWHFFRNDFLAPVPVIKKEECVLPVSLCPFDFKDRKKKRYKAEENGKTKRSSRI